MGIEVRELTTAELMYLVVSEEMSGLGRWFDFVPAMMAGLTRADLVDHLTRRMLRA